MNCSVGCSVLNLYELDLAEKHQCRSYFSSSPSTVSGLQLWHSGSNRTDPEVPGGAWEEGRASASEPAPPPDRFVHSDRLLPTVAWEMITGRPPAHWCSLSICTTSPSLSICLFLETEEEEETLCFADPTRFITDPDFCYQEFARREEDHFQVFRVQVGLIYLLV